MNYDNLIAVDPGASGAAVIRSARGEVRFVIPYKGRHSVIETLERVRLLPDGMRTAALIERVWASPVMGKAAAFSFGGNYEGWIHGFLARGIPVFGVTPQEWQKAIVPRVTGTGDARKHNLQDVAKVMFDLPVGEPLLPPGTRITLVNCDALLLSELAVLRNAAGIPLGHEIQ
jgi:hypothetical protein